MKKFIAAISLTTAILSINSANARDQIRIVGSSTIYPFATVVAEEFGTKNDFRTPIVESTGTGGGMKLFCSGAGEDTPDITNASREIKDTEKQLCAQNGVKDIIEVKIGFDGIVLANVIEGDSYNLTKEQLFKAVAKKIVKDGKLVDNTNVNWSDIDKSLPNKKISVYGPPPTSGTRDAFVEIVMEGVCTKLPEFIAEYKDEEVLKKTCHLIREDGAYIESGENDNLIVQKLKANPDSLGIFGFSFLDQNASTVKGNKVNGVEPSFDNIADGSYPVSRSLYMYVKGEHIGKIAGVKEFLSELVSEDATGSEGYLSLKGLIPLPEADLEKVRATVEAIK